MVYTKQIFFETPLHPGLTLEEILESKNMSQKELAIRIGVTPKHINGIINGNNNITAEFAFSLEKVLGIPASFWNNLQKSYDEDYSRLQAKQTLVQEQEELKKYTVYNRLARRGLVSQTRDSFEKLISLQMFFSVSSLFNIEKLTQVVYRKYSADVSQENFNARVRVGELIADKIEVQSFSKIKLKSILPQLKKLTQKGVIDIKVLETMFASVGIKLVFVPGFEKVPVVGLTRNYKSSPLIQISDRGKKSDIFWFTLFHEIGHILYHLSSKADFFVNSGKGNNFGIEQEADIFAQNALIDQEVYEREISKGSINLGVIAKESNVGLCIVAGRIAKDFDSKNKKIRGIVGKFRKEIEVRNVQFG